MFVKHIIKTLDVSVTVVLTIFRGPSFVLSAVTTSLLVYVVKLFISYMPDVLLCGMFGCELFTTKHPTDKNIKRAHTETTYSHISNKQLDDANKHRSSNSTKHERRPPEDGQTIVTETCRVFNDVFYTHF